MEGTTMRSNPYPPVRQMLREAVEALGSPTTNVAVQDWIQATYPGTKWNTVQCHFISCCVNQPSRVYYPEGGRPRTCNNLQKDFLYRPARGVLERYDPEKHGIWMIEQDAEGQWVIRQKGGEPIYPEPKRQSTRPQRQDRKQATHETGAPADEVEIITPPALGLAWSEWKPMSQQGNRRPPGAPEKAGVYQIRSCLDCAECEIVYIGLSARGVKGLRGRIDNHRTRAGQCADNLVNKQRFWELAREPIEVRWAVTEHPHYAEGVLLRQFKDAHGRLPRFNTDG